MVNKNQYNIDIDSQQEDGEHWFSEHEKEGVTSFLNQVHEWGAESAEPKASVKEDLLDLFKQQHEKKRLVWLNSIGLWLFPKDKKWFASPGVQMLSLTGCIAVIILIFNQSDAAKKSVELARLTTEEKINIQQKKDRNMMTFFKINKFKSNTNVATSMSELRNYNEIAEIPAPAEGYEKDMEYKLEKDKIDLSPSRTKKKIRVLNGKLNTDLYFDTNVGDTRFKESVTDNIDYNEFITTDSLSYNFSKESQSKNASISKKTDVSSNDDALQESKYSLIKSFNTDIIFNQSISLKSSKDEDLLNLLQTAH